ncbi:lipopolysaccharide heptosyltransferase I [Campylobacter concisus]|jgi:lipopolysaccharide heptosyltransferase I|uniref:lipopolysaccharide heptosyltransferase I n=1 Tax=Campylobacter concisus TaxID=199 RepID=UPI000CD844F2|nr:lipopolysaccharide heptosyltransferase I [Campylobacter concisus]MCA6129917.1 lipopolysaccharide heptosyltransferase I [Campylobacter concisus]MCA6131868.1 lipopolysaccharide heptosyltransferase I [Campylobacter concisus]
MQDKNQLKIAIVKLSALGDIVHAAIVLQFIKKHCPNAHITWLVDARFASLLKDHPLIDELVVLPLKESFKKSYKIIKTLGKFDKIIDLQGLFKSAVVAKLLGKEIYGFSRESVKEKIAARLYKHKFKIDYNENIIVRNLSLVGYALNFSFDRDEILKKSPCFEICKKFKNESGKKRVLIAAFASEESKIYDKFKDVIRLLEGCEIYLCYGSESEKARAEVIISGTSAKLLEKLSIKDMIDFIASCDLVIGNDSGLTHLAWAVNRPSITLFGNRPSHRNAYVTDKNLVVDMGKQIDARSIDKNDFCIREIFPETVANFAKRLLNG